MSSRLAASAFLALLALYIVASAHAQDAFPTHPITMIVPFPPGGVADLTGRPTAYAMEKILRQRVIVEKAERVQDGSPIQRVSAERLSP